MELVQTQGKRIGIVKKILYIANYQEGVGGISGQVEMLHNCVNSDPYEADIFSTKGNIAKRLWKFIELICIAREYDVLHIHGCSERGMLPILYGVIAGKIWGKKIIVTYHGGGAEEYFAHHDAFARRWLCRADKVIVLNGYLEKVFKEYNIPCVVIPNIILLPDIKRTHEWNKKAPKFISVRHLRELYNIPCILRAFQQVQQQIPEASLTILGSGPLLEELQQYVRDNNLKHVTFAGQVPNQEMNRYLADHDIFLSAPRVDNMPVSVLEAMNAGTLVISSKVGGVPYMIEHLKTGLLFNSSQESGIRNQESEVRELAKEMLWAVEHQEESLKMIEAARKEVKKYSWNHIRGILLPLYS